MDKAHQLTDQAYLRALLARHGFHFSKAMGQNFLINPTVCPRMAAASGAGDPDCSGAIEIGPGVGVLTRELAAAAPKVMAIELDRRLFPLLAETLADCPNVDLVQGDVLKLDLAAEIAAHFPDRGEKKLAVCANLPYYITSPVLMGLLESGLPLRGITVMVQREAAERICAEPGQRACGAVSAAVWYRAVPELLFRVERGSFLPQPNVDSAVLRLTLRDTPPVALRDEAQFFALVRAAFSQRRKTAANAIVAGSEGRWTKPQVTAVLRGLGLPENARAEALSLSQLADLANGLAIGQKTV